MTNQYFGFTKQDLETFGHLGVFKFLPQWMQGTIDDKMAWNDFLLRSNTCALQRF
jgi:hypothetical protein